MKARRDVESGAIPPTCKISLGESDTPGTESDDESVARRGPRRKFLRDIGWGLCHVTFLSTLAGVIVSPSGAGEVCPHYIDPDYCSSHLSNDNCSNDPTRDRCESGLEPEDTCVPTLSNPDVCPDGTDLKDVCDILRPAGEDACPGGSAADDRCPVSAGAQDEDICPDGSASVDYCRPDQGDQDVCEVGSPDTCSAGQHSDDACQPPVDPDVCYPTIQASEDLCLPPLDPDELFT